MLEYAVFNHPKKNDNRQNPTVLFKDKTFVHYLSETSLTNKSGNKIYELDVYNITYYSRGNIINIVIAMLISIDKKESVLFGIYLAVLLKYELMTTY